jgi:hypothetical protein
MHKNPRSVGCVNLKQVLSDIRDDCQNQRSNKRVFSKPTGSKLVKRPAESGEICSVEVEEK